MSLDAVIEKIIEKFSFYFSYRNVVRRIAYRLNKYSVGLFEDRYEERAEVGPVNLDSKLIRKAGGGPFEPYDVSLVNKAALQLIGKARNILEIGCGTGMFASLAAQNPDLQISATEFDEKTLEWAIHNRPAPNITYSRTPLGACVPDQFELVVCIEVIEHIWDYASFLKQLSSVAQRAIITTPNKNASALGSIANTPEYGEHVREWTAGEFFWVLRSFYDDVQLFTLPDFESQVNYYKNDSNYVPSIKECSVNEYELSLIAYCSKAKR